MEIQIVNGCVDRPDPRDYPFEEVFGSADALPVRVFHNRTRIQNQSLPNVPSTKYGCTCFAAAHAVNEGNAIEYERAGIPGTFAEALGSELVAKAVPLGLDVNSGWDLQSARKMVLNLGYVSGFTRCYSSDECKAALSVGQQIHTGSRSIDWAKTAKNGFLAVEGVGYAHAFAIVGYDDEMEIGGKTYAVFVCRNSYGPDFQSHGHFFILQSDFRLLYTCAAFVDKPNAEAIVKEQSARRRQEAKYRGIWDGNRENENVTRYEAFLMAVRASKTALPESSIWNGERRDQNVTRGEAELMLERAFGRPFPFPLANLGSNATRGEMAEMSVRF